jgi:rubrerythrin
VALDLFKEKGVPLDRQVFTWKDLVQRPYSKLDDDAFTRVRVILMNGIEADSLRFKHMVARLSRLLREPLALVRRAEHHQQTLINWLNPPDQSPIETTIGFEQVAIEVTASVALKEPDAYLAQTYRFGMLEDFDHLYRYAALYDRMEGKDPNWLIQSYSDIRPGRPTVVEHRHPLDDLRRPYDMRTARPLSKIHALLITAAEYQTHDFYMTIGPMFADPVARQLYAEIASVEEQHVTQYSSLIDPDESLLEKWMLHEAMELYAYYSCLAYESNPRIRAIWDRMVAYELGHLHYVMDLFQRLEGRDPAEVLPATLPDLIEFKSHREFVRRVLSHEVDLRAHGTQFVDKAEVPPRHRSLVYRDQLNYEGSPSESVAAGYQWTPGTEVAVRVVPKGLGPEGRLQ